MMTLEDFYGLPEASRYPDSKSGPCWHEGCPGTALWPQGVFPPSIIRCSNGHVGRARVGLLYNHERGTK